MVWETEYDGQPVKTVGSALKLSGTPVAPPRPIPKLGEHTESVLREYLGYDDAQIAAVTRR